MPLRYPMQEKKIICLHTPTDFLHQFLSHRYHSNNDLTIEALSGIPCSVAIVVVKGERKLDLFARNLNTAQ